MNVIDDITVKEADFEKLVKNQELVRGEEIFNDEHSIKRNKEILCLYRNLFSSVVSTNSVSNRLDEIVDLIKKNVVNKSDMEDAKNEIIRGQEKGFENIAQIIQENEDLRKILNKKYTVKTLFLCASSISLILAFSLCCWFLYDFPLIHPVLSIPLLIASLSFSILAFWKME
jgi:hypothetical protein